MLGACVSLMGLSDTCRSLVGLPHTKQAEGAACDLLFWGSRAAKPSRGD